MFIQNKRFYMLTTNMLSYKNEHQMGFFRKGRGLAVYLAGVFYPTKRHVTQRARKILQKTETGTSISAPADVAFLNALFQLHPEAVRKGWTRN